MRLPLDILKNPDAPASALLALAIFDYGLPVCQSSTPEELRESLQNDYSVTITDLQSDKLNAALIALTTDLFQHQWEVFTTLCHIFCNIHASFDSFHPLEAEYLAAGLAEFYIINDDEDPKFSDDVKVFAGNVFSNYGLSKAPDIFPDAVMPELAGEHDERVNQEKSDALTDIFNAKTETVTEYLRSLSFPENQHN